MGVTFKWGGLLCMLRWPVASVAQLPCPAVPWHALGHAVPCLASPSRCLPTALHLVPSCPAGPFYVEALQQNAELQGRLQEAHTVLGTYDSRRNWGERERLLDAAAALAAACHSVAAWLAGRESGAAAAVSVGGAAQPGTLAYHELEAAQLQAELQAQAATAAEQGGGSGGNDDGWTTVGRKGPQVQVRGALVALDLEFQEVEMEDDNIYDALDLLDDAEAAGGKGKKKRSRGGKKAKKKKAAS